MFILEQTYDGHPQVQYLCPERTYFDRSRDRQLEKHSKLSETVGSENSGFDFGLYNGLRATFGSLAEPAPVVPHDEHFGPPLRTRSHNDIHA